MGRPLWFIAGAGAGLYAAVRARRAADSLTADGLRDRLHSWQVGARMFATEVATAQAEKEAELRDRLGLLPAPGVAELAQPNRPDKEREGTDGHQ